MITIVAIFAAIKGEITSSLGKSHVVKMVMVVAALDVCTIILAGQFL